MPLIFNLPSGGKTSSGSSFSLPTWLNLGGVTDEYSTIEDVLGDENATLRLMTIHASVDYLINNGLTAVSKICGSEIAMTCIGEKDYAADMMLANTSWRNAIFNSNYWELVLRDKVPTMTSNSAPEGEVSCSSQFNTTVYAAYTAFNGKHGSEFGGWEPASTDTFGNAYVQYKFAYPINIRKVMLYRYQEVADITTQFKISASNDGTTFTDLLVTDALVTNKEHFINLDNTSYYMIYRITIEASSNSEISYGQGINIQFYGRGLHVSVPTMTNNTSPSGECFCSETNWNTAYQPYNAFDKTESTWETAVNGGMDSYIGYKFEKLYTVNRVSITGHTNSNYETSSIKDFCVEASTDGNTFNAITDIFTCTNKTGENVFNFENDNAYLAYRIRTVSNYGNNFISISEIQFYGVDYSEDVEEPDVSPNYTMLYDFGDECEDVTGGINSYPYTVSGWNNSNYLVAPTLTKNSDTIDMSVTSASTNQTGSVFFENLLNLSEYNKVVARVSASITQRSTSEYDFVSMRITSNKGNPVDTIGSVTWCEAKTSKLSFSGISTLDISDIDEGYLSFNFGASRPTNTNAKATIYNVFLTKPDDFAKLCAKAGLTAPTTLAELIADTTALTTIFNSEIAVNYMVKYCTGDFMVSVLNNETAVGLLKESPYLNKVIANIHWAKFMMMLPTAKSLLNYTMLYDFGDECEDVTGGWGIDGYTRTSYILSAATKSNNAIVCVCSATGKVNGAGSINPISLVNYSNLYINAKATGTISTHNLQAFCSTSKTISENTYFATYSKGETGIKNLSLGEMQDTRYIYFDAPNDSARSAEVYNVFLTRADDFTKWASIAGITATDLDTLLADTNSLEIIMNNKSAMKYLAGCTGDLMIAILNSDTASEALYDSLYKDILLSHPIWNKFIKMINPSLFGYTMLYDFGDECEDVTGGWNGTDCNTNGLTGSIGTLESSYIKQSYTNSTSQPSCYNQTVNKVDLTKYNNIYANLDFTGNNPINTVGNLFNILINSTTTIMNSNNNEIYNTLIDADPYVASFRGIKGVDISSLSGSKYINYHTWYAWRQSATATTNIYNIFLTRADNFTKWASIAGITATDLSTLLADTTSLTQIFNDKRACEFLMCCRGDLMISILNNSTVMGLFCDSLVFDYALDNPVWRKFMFTIPTSLEAVRNVLVSIPTMTSNTEPSGVATVSSDYNGNYPAYQAFDKKESTFAYGGTNVNGLSSMPWILQYEFAKMLKLYNVVLAYKGGSSDSTYEFEIQVSEDGENFINIQSFSGTSDSSNTTQNVSIILDNPRACKYIRIYQTSGTKSGDYTMITIQALELNAYGKEV